MESLAWLGEDRTFGEACIEAWMLGKSCLHIKQQLGGVGVCFALTVLGLVLSLSSLSSLSWSVKFHV